MEKRNPLICWHGSGNVEQCRRKKGAEYIILQDETVVLITENVKE